MKDNLSVDQIKRYNSLIGKIDKLRGTHVDEIADTKTRRKVGDLLTEARNLLVKKVGPNPLIFL